MKTRFMKIDEVKKITSLSRSTIWRLQMKGQFPKRFPLSGNRVAWLESDIAEWVCKIQGIEYAPEFKPVGGIR